MQDQETTVLKMQMFCSQAVGIAIEDTAATYTDLKKMAKFNEIYGKYCVVLYIP